MDMDSSGDDGDIPLMSKAFYVDDALPSFDGPPMSAEEYLRQVRWEASGISEVIIAPDREKRQRDSVGGSVPEMRRLSSPLPRPTSSVDCEFEKNLLEDFTLVRDLFENSRHKIESVDQENFVSDILPGAADEQQWRRLCFSETSGRSPLVSTVASMDQVTVASVLRYYDQWFNFDNPERDGCLQYIKMTESGHRAHWLFALLVALDKPLDGDTAASLRSLLRKFSGVRATASASLHKMDVSASKVFMAVLGGYFEQYG
eukprot:Plantae.Rhodophyta-Purpureofilum_apyrenoidigerum.ctg391.p1 GENE.Plantae.Rhodophyta-Purpureofilum_apyrenoidigerum.ctg391~~Plantae.Rhodophyta-Purpureofilum_apyrenoidigerum.ctg391.p1  ORF type:complete len:259 (-),score=43.17 Plantae.Rhodophyta-Purpureofilum_apyrenoidigerum.ctg391:237-1013(-)